MASRQLFAAVCVLALVGAGCQGLEPEPETVTPIEVPSATGETTTDVTQLVEQHRDTLENQSHTTTVTLVVEYPNGSVAQRTDTFAVGSDGTYLYERRTVGPYPETLDNLSIWQNGTHEVRRESGTVTVEESVGVDDTTLGPYIERVLGVFDLTAESTGNGYRLTGEAERAQSVPLPTPLLDHRNARADIELRDDILRNVTVDLQADHYTIDRTVDIRIGVTVEDVGTTDPTAPAWADGATADS